jgi:hypothetical protein
MGKYDNCFMRHSECYEGFRSPEGEFFASFSMTVIVSFIFFYTACQVQDAQSRITQQKDQALGV